ncbi:hypothetical protein ACJA25_00050 [Mycoplasmopsis hyopharyngis]|uniref:hypothetical protein n=1 Tax=Mycoplasmopsis hyopharyngis TaxID=29558 RepID=UPI003872D051
MKSKKTLLILPALSLSSFLPVVAASCTKNNEVTSQINSLKNEFNQSIKFFLDSDKKSFLNLKNHSLLKTIAWNYAKQLTNTLNYYSNFLVTKTKEITNKKDSKEVEQFVFENIMKPVAQNFVLFINSSKSKIKNNEKLDAETKKEIFEILIKHYQDIAEILNPYLSTSLNFSSSLDPLFLSATKDLSEYTYTDFVKAELKKDNLVYDSTTLAKSLLYSIRYKTFFDACLNLNVNLQNAYQQVKQIDDLNLKYMNKFIQNVKDFKGLDNKDSNAIEWVKFYAKDSQLWDEVVFNNKKQTYLDLLEKRKKEAISIYQTKELNLEFEKNVIAIFIKLLK